MRWIEVPVNSPLLKDLPLPPGELNPSDHVRLLVELLRPLGPQLARRWVAALLAVDAHDRAALVEMIENRVAELYADSPRRPAERQVTLVGPPRQRDGYVEQVETTFEVREEPAASRRSGRARKSK